MTITKTTRALLLGVTILPVFSHTPEGDIAYPIGKTYQWEEKGISQAPIAIAGRISSGKAEKGQSYT